MHRENRDYKGGPGDGGENCGDTSCGDGRQANGGEQDHSAHTAQLWESAFFDALQDLRIEALKSALKKSPFAKNLDATAKDVVDAMYKEWQEFKAREEQEEKRSQDRGPEGLQKLFKKGKKGPQ